MARLTFHITTRTLLLALLLAPVGRSMGPATVDEYQMKALYILNFAQFVEWPPAAFTSGSHPLQICIAGENPFGRSLLNAVADKQASGRSFKVREVKAGRPVTGCHVLFIPASEREQQGPILGSARGLSVLTVGETENFLEAGGMVVLRPKAGRLRFAIAQDAALAAGLKVSSKLLQLSDSTILARGE